MKRGWKCNENIYVCTVRMCKVSNCDGTPVVIRTAKEDRARSSVISLARKHLNKRNAQNYFFLNGALKQLDKVRKEKK